MCAPQVWKRCVQNTFQTSIRYQTQDTNITQLLPRLKENKTKDNKEKMDRRTNQLVTGYSQENLQRSHTLSCGCKKRIQVVHIREPLWLRFVKIIRRTYKHDEA